ncbi:hypothetical protein FDG96_gp79 [Bacillus phage Mgbh1]|uniref:Uncharacterized protein n=1 Tax=Bacillus phage Mgbh1 TaxID=1796993 RepID=A0A142F1T1_9CAUD|nr:hypothetical protein FDG96_gp79 [Bacillus phage Mgbh1]AMQ66738.1 hypothetical protein [Bacillus phage Mgbh1]
MDGKRKINEIKWLLNKRLYTRSRAETGNPELIIDNIDIERAIKDADLTTEERETLRVHYDIVGGDSVKGGPLASQFETSRIVGLSQQTVSYRLKSAHRKIADVYFREEVGV